MKTDTIKIIIIDDYMKHVGKHTNLHIILYTSFLVQISKYKIISHTQRCSIKTRILVVSTVVVDDRN